MFLFEGAFGSILHTGDCRLTPDCLHALPLSDPSRRIDYVYLDCTFVRCPLAFPSKEDSIRQVLLPICYCIIIQRIATDSELLLV